MKIIFPILLLSFSFSCFGQNSSLAVGTYTKNGKLIGLANLSGLSDCSAQNEKGKVKDVEILTEIVRFSLKEKKESNYIEFRLERLSESDRKIVFNDLIKKNYSLRVAGYTCEGADAISAFSIEREN
ncbi:MAG: hypothetical protein ACRD6X_03265 [Pyrinomonadaceae bacterium]